MVRRESTWITRRISSSGRLRGRACRSGVFGEVPAVLLARLVATPPGPALVTRWLPRTSRSARQEIVVDDPDQVGQRQEQVLDGEILVAEVRRSGPPIQGRARSRLSWALPAVAPGQLGQRVLHPVANLSGASHPFEDRQGRGASWARRAGQQMAGYTSGLLRCLAASRRRERSWVLRVQRLGSSATAVLLRA